MDWTWYLFGFKGRINRAKCWLAGLIISCWMVFLMLLLILPIGYLFGSPVNFNFSIDNLFVIFEPGVVSRAVAVRYRRDRPQRSLHAAVSVGVPCDDREAPARPRQERLVDGPVLRRPQSLRAIRRVAARLLFGFCR